MGRKSSAKKQKRNHSSIASHKRKGKELIAPFMQIPNLKTVSWRDERLPGLIWIGLILKSTENEIDNKRNVKRICEYFRYNKLTYIPKSLSWDEIVKMKDAEFFAFLDYLTKELNLVESLKPLLLFNTLPSYEKIKEVLGHIDLDEKSVLWEKLYFIVGNMLAHNSDLSTDCRWASVLFLLATNQYHDPNPEEILNYAERIDVSSIKSKIRATEMALEASKKFIASEINEELTPIWADEFWKEGLEKSPCWILRQVSDLSECNLEDAVLEECESQIKELFLSSLKTTAVDAELEADFSFTLYCLSLLKEINKFPKSVTARLALRTIVECYITMAYLQKKNDSELWETYRSYGSGQAKLAFLKIDQIGETPNYVSLSTLEMLANEDNWQEFTNINLGHWENSNLREMSEKAGVKEVYMKYYDWTSGFSHGQWSALRSVVFDYCGNPLHRLHRIPSEGTMLPNVLKDAVELFNKMLMIINKKYSSEIEVNL